MYLLLVPVGPLIACWVSLVVLVVPLAWWLAIVVCWVVAACLLHYFSSLVLLDWRTPPNLHETTISPHEDHHTAFLGQHLSIHLDLLHALEEETNSITMTTFNNWHHQVNYWCTTKSQGASIAA